MLKARQIFRLLVKGYRAKKRKEMEALAGVPRKPAPVTAEFPKKTLEVTGKLRLLPPEEKKPKAIEIPEFTTKRISKVGLKEEEEETTFQATYPLIPEKPMKGEPILAYAQIKWDPKKSCYVYNVIQPTLSPRMKKVFARIKSLLEEKLDVDLTKLKKIEARDYLHKQTSQLLDYFGIKLSEEEKLTLGYYIDRDFLGMGIIEPLMRDPNIEDISCDGVGIPIYVFHRNPILGSIPTNLIFHDAEELDSYLVRLAQLCGQAISVIDPLLDGTLPDGSRIQGTLATDIARRGSNFSIRKFTKFPFTPTHILQYGTTDIKTMAFLWLCVDLGCSVLVSGGTATGKTVFLNVLSLFIKPEMKIVSIEDTAELRLPHPHWVPHVARVPITTEEGRRRGEVDLFDLLKESLRQRPDYIIVGEVRGKEAYVLFQQMATGHPSLATIHSDTLEKLTNRLITPPISLPPSLLENLDLIIFLTKMKYKGKYVRKLKSVYEVIGFDTKENKLKTNKLLEWDATTDKMKIVNKSVTLQKIVERTGSTEKKIIEELKRRMVVLHWLKKKNITDYRDFARVMNLYYDFPERVLDIISGEI
jgi:flagellar protein FlaI